MKDRARPFSRKHRRYWLTVTGGMIAIMSVNVGLGWWVYKTDDNERPEPHYEPLVPIPPGAIHGPGVDAGVDAPPD